MNRDDLMRAMSAVDDDILLRSEQPAATKRWPVMRRWAALAACLALVLGLTGLGIAAEAKEYGEAVAFFEENDLPLEGLSRAEVKAVYRDITTQHFSLDKTAEVIQKSVPGGEILQRAPTAEEMRDHWNSRENRPETPASGTTYTLDYVYREDETLGFDVLEKSVLRCRLDGKALWSAEFPEFSADGYQAFPNQNRVLVWGRTPTWSSEQTTFAWVACLDGDGNRLWVRELDHGFEDEHGSAVLENDDGTWAVISRGDYKCLCLTTLSADGQELAFAQNEIGNLGIWNAVRLGDGYLVQVGNYTGENGARLVKLSPNGEIADQFSYSGPDCVYTITDMAEFGGQVYLSAYAVPRKGDEPPDYELDGLWEQIEALSDQYGMAIPTEELTPLLREHYTAELLLCDLEGGEPAVFYSVQGSFGGKLTVEGDRLLWDVESIVSSLYSPYTNSYSLGGDCEIFQYAFDSNGTLADTVETGTYKTFKR